MTVPTYFRIKVQEKPSLLLYSCAFFSRNLTPSDARGIDASDFNFTDERTRCHLLQLQLPGPRFTKDIRFIQFIKIQEQGAADLVQEALWSL